MLSLSSARVSRCTFFPSRILKTVTTWVSPAMHTSFVPAASITHKTIQLARFNRNNNSSSSSPPPPPPPPPPPFTDNTSSSSSSSSSGPSFHVRPFRRGPKIRVDLDGQPLGYIVIGILAACLGFGVARHLFEENNSHKKGSSKRKKEKDQVLAPTSSAPITVSNAITLLPAANIAPHDLPEHPVLKHIAPYGLPQLPFLPTGSQLTEEDTQINLAPPLLVQKAFVSAFNTKTHTADWVLEHLAPLSSSASSSSSSSSSDSLTSPDGHVSSRDKSSFHVDALISPGFQASLSSYHSSGYDRGHLMPAADVSFEDQSVMDSTFTLSNVAPQHPQLNRGFWLQLEHHIRNLTHLYKHVFVITGPAWIPHDVPQKRNNQQNQRMKLETEVLGDFATGQHVYVPTHFFKVILAVEPTDKNTKTTSDSMILGSFLVPNSPIDIHKQNNNNASLSPFAIPLEEAERLAGWRFFPRIPRTTTTATASSTETDANSPQVVDMCSQGHCALRLKEFDFSKKQAKQQPQPQPQHA